MVESEQSEIFKIQVNEKKQKIPKRKMGFLGENMREFVRAPKDKFCAKCGKPLEKGLLVVKIAPLIRGKPDISKLEYFHRQNTGSCLE